MKILSKLQQGSTRTLNLTAATQELKEQGLLEADQRIVARIRKVRASEIAAAIGTTPLLFALARTRRKGESLEEFNERMQAELLDDPRLVQDAQQQQLSTQTAVVALGVTALGVATGESQPEWEAVTLDVHGGEPSVSVLGASLEEVHDAIVSFGNLPYTRLGVAGLETFPGEPPSPAGESSGGVLRDDADAVPEPPTD